MRFGQTLYLKADGLLYLPERVYNRFTFRQVLISY